MVDDAPKTLTQQLAFRELGENSWTTVHPPQRVGNMLPIAYGGYALAVACKAAILSVPEAFYMYSAMGNFMSPASTARPLLVHVRTVRQTRTFATRHVEVSQLQDDGTSRTCLFVTVDFHSKEKESVLVYSRTPTRQYTGHAQLPSTTEHANALLAAGKITPTQHKAFIAMFAVITDLFTVRLCPEGIFAHNLVGLAKTLPHPQEHIPITQRATADWFRSATTLETRADHIAALAFYTDGPLAYTPLSLEHMFLDDCAACTSLDFALRIFGDVDMNEWTLREISTKVGGEGRSFSEAWFWDERGRAVACMSQQVMLRPVLEKGKL
ncbi:acyl-CoA hydrolase [Alternaria alternata]|nr:acyl-CoA hydrolase [Alternaria alternata]OWY56382.1 acyl-CoA hydrolase [Alternaria alternata]